MVLEGRGSLEVISALIIKTPGSSLTPLPCEDTASVTQTEDIYFFMVLEASSPRSRCRQAGFSRGLSPCLAVGHLFPVYLPGLLSVCLFSNFFLQGHQSYWIRAHPNHFILPYLPSLKEDPLEKEMATHSSGGWWSPVWVSQLWTNPHSLRSVSNLT